MTKYKTKPVIWDVAQNKIVKSISKDTIRFDSTFEFTVYQKLTTLVGIRNIEMQVPLLIKPGSGAYPELAWKCDFRIYRQNNLCDWLNVEAKGLPTREFKRNLQYLELFSPHDYKRLMVIGTSNESSYIDCNVDMWTLDGAIRHLTRDGWQQEKV